MNAKRRPRVELKESKVQLRLRPMQKAVIRRAAEIKETSLTSFMVEHAVNAAQQVIADQTSFTLPADRWNTFCDALDRPPKDIPALRRLLTEPGVFDPGR
jgi:uncharacterized protein (DUF1778 family)